MSITLYNSCIEELEIPQSNKRNLDKISGYLSSLKNFMLIIRSKKENIKSILDKISSVMRLRKAKKNEIIINEGEKGKEFFILLKGKISVLTPKINEYYMSKEEYILYLLQLRLKDQNELINKCLSLNQNIYSIHEDNFDSFIYNLSLGKTLDESFSKDITLIKKAKTVYQFICDQNKNIESSTNQEDIIEKEVLISPEDYIIQNSVSQKIVENTILIENYIKKTEVENSNNNDEKMNKSLDEDEEDDDDFVKKLLNNRSKVFIPTHEIFGELESGSYFGEMALEEKGSGKRNATLIAAEECYIGAINKNDYFSLLKYYIEKAQNKYISFISTFYIFKNLSITIWEKRYITLFINRIYEKDYLLLKEGEANDQVYFIYKGDFELTTNKNLIEVNELIIYYKKKLRELLSKFRNSNKEMFKYSDYRDEIKENENFKLNKKFEDEKMKKLVFDKKMIKMGIFSSKEIIGLLDIYTPIKANTKDMDTENDNFRIKNYQMKSLYNCQCVSCNCEVYSFPLIKFSHMCQHEDKVGLLTKEFEIKKIYFMIKRLKHYKDFLYESNFFKENESKKEIKKMKNKKNQKGIKNKFEVNIEYSNLNIKNDFFNIPKNKKFKNGFLFERKLSNSLSNYKFPNKILNRNKNNIKLNNLQNQTYTKDRKNSEILKIKNKYLGLPKIEDIGENNEKLNLNEKTNRLNAENEIYSYSQKNKGIILINQGSQKSTNKTRNYFLENNNINNKHILTDNEKKINNLRNNIFIKDKNNNKIIFSKKPLIKKHNWVAKVLVKNLVYNHIFGKFAFSSINSRNNYNSTYYNHKNYLKTSEEIDKLKRKENKSTNKNSLLKSADKNYLKNKININRTEPNLFLNKKDKDISSISKINKVKSMKMEINNENKKEKEKGKNIICNSNGIYDALIYDNFNNYYNERVYKNFFAE